MLALTVMTSRALAQEGADAGPTAPPILPSRWDVESASYWVVGVAVESAGRRLDGGELIQDTLYGLSVAHRLAFLLPHLRLLVTVNPEGYEETRYFGGAGLRAYFAKPWGVDLAFGTGAYFDAQLERHYWLAGVTPFELSATVYSRGSWRLEVTLGTRLAVAGELVDSYLVDPNGFHNESARDDLRAARDEQPWEGFSSIVFGRRIE